MMPTDRRVLMVSSEAAPFAKTGGLADVVGALPRALAARGVEIAVALPYYSSAARTAEHADRIYDLRVWLGAAAIDTSIRTLVYDGVRFYFVDCPPLYDRAGLYGDNGLDYPDNHIRFAVLCRAALGIVRHLFRPHVIHCHDWQAGLMGPLMRHTYAGDPTFAGIKLLFTIHNLGYQGLFGRASLAALGLDDSLYRPEALEFWGDVSFLKGGIVFADWINTVSEGYAREIQTPEYGFGLDTLLRSRTGVLSGIVNGVDYSEWNPETDPYIAAHFSVDDLRGKAVCKEDLLGEFQIAAEHANKPIIGIVSRFAPQKGFDLIEEVANQLAAEDIVLTVLGSGEPTYEEMFQALAMRYPGRIGVKVAYDNTLAHKIEAGADMFLMPSHYEPCGLNQIYSLRYGTVPIVRATGGLDDTIEKETGFKFHEYSGAALLDALRAAIAVWGYQDRWRSMMRKGMRKDFSWGASAAEYIQLYERLG